MNIKNKKWKEYYLISKDMFFIDNPKTLKSTSMVKKSGIYDVVGATSKNNGNVGFLNENNRNLLCKGNCICLIKTGEGSVGEAVYKYNDFIPSNNVCIIRSEWLNKYNGLFIVNEINKQSCRYNYGYIRNHSRILKEKIMIPVKNDGIPDYKFMEEYIKNKLENMIQNYNKNILKEIQSLNKLNRVSSKEIKWKEFVIGDLFEVNIGKCIDGNKVDKLNGKYAYVTRKETNNGIDGFIDYDDKFLNKQYPVITIGNETAKPYVQVFPFFTGTKVNILKPKRIMNKYILFFVCQSLMMNKRKYSYSFTINSTRLKKQNILLPVNQSNKIDFKYMENYIKKIILNKLKNYIEYNN